MGLLNKNKDDLENRKRCDELKNEFCKINNIKLIRIPHTSYNKIENILNIHVR